MHYPERIHLAALPTPLTFLPQLSRSLGRQVWVLRDDLTGFGLSGNKVRKLEFLLAEAVRNGASWLVTCGGPQSNHARATALAARQLGLGVTLVVREPRTGFDPDPVPTGNLLLDHLAGAEIRTVAYADYTAAGGSYDSFLADTAESLRRRGEKPYIVPEGGSSALGCFGYIAAMAELAETWRSRGPGGAPPDQIFVALGSGGTHAGMRLGCDAMDWPAETICAVNVCDDAAYFHQRVNALMDRAAAEFGINRRSDPLRIFDGHVGGGYAVATDEDLRFYQEMTIRDGLQLDPVYTGKAFRGMLHEIAKDPNAFGSRILFWHTGGLFGNFAFARQYQQALHLGPLRV